jgi:hypothetical protein
MGNMGRPRALDDAQRREVCALISAGCGFRTAAEYVGCSPSTIRREALRNPEFHEQVRSADLSCQLSPLQAIRKAAATNWRAAAWLLERTNPQRYGNQRKPAKSADVAEAMIDELFEAIRHEIKDDQLCNRIGIVVRTIVGKWQRDEWAEKHHRRNPGRAKRLISEIERARQPARERTGPKSVFDHAPVDPRTNPGFDIDPELKRKLDADLSPSEANAKCAPPPKPNESPNERAAKSNPARTPTGSALPTPHSALPPLPDGRGSERNRRDANNRDWKAERAAENAYCAQLAREAQALEDARQRAEEQRSNAARDPRTTPQPPASSASPTPQSPIERAESPHQNVFKSVQKSDASDGHRAQHPSEKQGPIERPPN